MELPFTHPIDPSSHPSDTRIQQFLSLPQKGAVVVTYMWQGGSIMDLRSKSKTYWVDEIRDLSDISVWNYDGSSTNQALLNNSEVFIKPRRIYKDPFTGYPNILVWCDQYFSNGSPIESNTRLECSEVMKKVEKLEPWFGLEQEYFMFSLNGRPLGFPKHGLPKPQGPYYCGTGSENSFGRDIQIAHYKACLYAGVKISGANCEVAPGQWEFQVGPCEGISAGDDLWVSRYILMRVAELFHVLVSFCPKPMSEWSGSGCHCNFSTRAMREETGSETIMKAVSKLELTHEKHIEHYGQGNELRLTGRHETAGINTFSYGVANRAASIRIHTPSTSITGGFLEDRRPAANVDPYIVTKMLVASICLD